MLIKEVYMYKNGIHLIAEVKKHESLDYELPCKVFINDIEYKCTEIFPIHKILTESMFTDVKKVAFLIEATQVDYKNLILKDKLDLTFAC